ncbi:hypothetical protein HHK36_017430 [Tetracentron sinense]|uniref:Uncharacterized protein n=1 Tax=Tetracentron sinense TaxID=13715 RepID=A0A834Z4C7_TETSI|nr:hypothetical protein HHK36_017430 [Tetracentron sinense]
MSRSPLFQALISNRDTLGAGSSCVSICSYSQIFHPVRRSLIQFVLNLHQLPGDSVVVTIEIHNLDTANKVNEREDGVDNIYVLLSQKSPSVLSPSQQRKHTNPLYTDDDTGAPSVPGTVDPVACKPSYFLHLEQKALFEEGLTNIRLDDQILLRFSPKNSDSYYFSYLFGGTLIFFYEEGSRRCLEKDWHFPGLNNLGDFIGQRSVHPSWRNSPTITKSVTIKVFLKPAEGDNYIWPTARGRGGRGRGRVERGGHREGFLGLPGIKATPAPCIKDPDQFPLLGEL